jgi:hypothetical protein
MSTVSARFHIVGRADLQPASPFSQSIGHTLENVTGGEGWRNGTASGQVDRVYMVSGSLGSGATDAYDLLAAGSLTDALGQAIDADELKALILRCDTGAIEMTANATNGIGLFKAASDGINLGAGNTAGFSFGAAGLDVTTDSKFNITEATSGAAATYTLWLIVAQ